MNAIFRRGDGMCLMIQCMPYLDCGGDSGLSCDTCKVVRMIVVHGS